MMSNLCKGFLSAGDKTFLRYIQHQKDKYDYGKNIYKDKLMMLVLNNYENMCTKDKCLAKSPEQQQVVALSTELEKMKDTNIQLKKFLKAKGVTIQMQRVEIDM